MPQAAAGMRMDPPVSVPMVRERHAGGDADRRAAARTAWRPRRIVWIARGAERRILVRRAERELVQVGLADEDGACLAQVRDGRRVACGHVAVAHARGGGRRRAADVEQILERDRDAVQRAAVAPGRELAVGLARLRRASSAMTRMNAFRRGCRVDAVEARSTRSTALISRGARGGRTRRWSASPRGTAGSTRPSLYGGGRHVCRASFRRGPGARVARNRQARRRRARVDSARLSEPFSSGNPLRPHR